MMRKVSGFILPNIATRSRPFKCGLNSRITSVHLRSSASVLTLRSFMDDLHCLASLLSHYTLCATLCAQYSFNCQVPAARHPQCFRSMHHLNVAPSLLLFRDELVDTIRD